MQEIIEVATILRVQEQVFGDIMNRHWFKYVSKRNCKPCRYSSWLDILLSVFHLVQQHVQDLISSWADHFSTCNLIFYRAVGPHNRSVLFGGKNPPLDKQDSRLRTIPFPTRRATYNEVKRVHGMLSFIEIHGKNSLCKLHMSLGTFTCD